MHEAAASGAHGAASPARSGWEGCTERQGRSGARLEPSEGKRRKRLTLVNYYYYVVQYLNLSINGITISGMLYIRRSYGFLIKPWRVTHVAVGIYIDLHMSGSGHEMATHFTLQARNPATKQ